jgi:hypothetical protein
MIHYQTWPQQAILVSDFATGGNNIVEVFESLTTSF